MATDSFTEINQRIEEERRKKYLGTASIDFRCLGQPSILPNPTRKSNVLALKRIFQEERGCRQEDSRHHAKATISSDVFQQALASANVSMERLREDNLPFVKLDIPQGVILECLQGLDRMSAADEVFSGSRKRWVVDLYSNGLLAPP